MRLSQLRTRATTCGRRGTRTSAYSDRQPSCSRRWYLAIPAGFVAGCSSASTNPADDILKDLTADGPIANYNTSWVVNKKKRQVFYPASFEGTWQVNAALRSVTFPQGQSYLSSEVPGVTKASMITVLPDVGAGMEQAVTYKCRFVRSNSDIIADRVFNQQSLLDAFLAYPATGAVEYNLDDDPTRMRVVYTTRRQDTLEQTTDIRKAELFINARRQGICADGGFCASETYRQVNQAKKQGFVYDYESLWHYQSLSQGHMAADLRVAAFLLPSSPGFFSSAGKSVAHYDYVLDMRLDPNVW